jgi:hypothetical protein
LHDEVDVGVRAGLPPGNGPEDGQRKQLKLAAGPEDVHPRVLLEAGSPILKVLAAERGYTRRRHAPF